MDNDLRPREAKGQALSRYQGLYEPDTSSASVVSVKVGAILAHYAAKLGRTPQQYSVIQWR
jgi:hypothetical protein